MEAVEKEVKTAAENSTKAQDREDERFMRQAIALAESAARRGNEPFGALLVRDGEVLLTNENQIYSAGDPTFHAESGLLRRLCAEKGITDLQDCTLYSSCEPCFMCSGAMVWMKLGRLVYGASDLELCELIGISGSRPVKIVFSEAHAATRVTAGVLREESLQLLRNYFKDHEKG